MNRAPSLTALLAAFPSVGIENLRLIRTVWHTVDRAGVRLLADAHAPNTREWVRSCFHEPHSEEVQRRIVDELLDTYGVEYLGTHKRSGESVYYCNSGDTYAATLIFHGSNMYIGCWGDLVEGNKIREAETL